MPNAGKARVTAVFEVAAKLAPQLESLLRNSVTPQFPCTFIEVSTHAESELQQTEAGAGRIEQGKRDHARPVDAGKDGELARHSGEGEQKQIGGDSSKGASRAVPSQASWNVGHQPKTANSGAREEMSGDSVIVP